MVPSIPRVTDLRRYPGAPESKEVAHFADVVGTQATRPHPTNVEDLLGIIVTCSVQPHPNSTVYRDMELQ